MEYIPTYQNLALAFSSPPDLERPIIATPRSSTAAPSSSLSPPLTLPRSPRWIWTGLQSAMDSHHLPTRPGQPSRLAIARPQSPAQPAPSSPQASSSRQAHPQPHRFAHIQEVVYDEKKAGPVQLEDLSKWPSGRSRDMSPIAGPSSHSRAPVASPVSSIPPWIRSQRPHHPRPLPFQPPFSPAPCPIASSWPSSTSISSTSSPSPTSHYTRPRGLRIANLIKPWIPIILYIITTLAFLVAVSFWKVEVFQGALIPRSTAVDTGCSHCMHDPIMTGLDELSRWLKSDTYLGYAVIFTLIFVTTFRKCQSSSCPPSCVRSL